MGFDLHLAREGAELIHALSRGGIAPTLNERSTDTQVLVTEWNGRTLVVFPGSDSARDWRTNLQTQKVAHRAGGAVHIGFHWAHQMVSADLISELLSRTSRQIVVMGHSLGGSLAMLTALELIRKWVGTNIQVYTYGQPRVGNGAFARAYNAQLNDRTYRIVNADDPVPYLPPWLAGYRHAGREVFLNKAGGFVVARSLFSQWQTSAAAVVESFQANQTQALLRVSAHGIGAYLKKLQG